MKSLSLRLPDSLDASLARVARRRRTNKSAVAREALDVFLNGRRGRRLSALDLAGDLVGCLEGPARLATKPKHVEARKPKRKLSFAEAAKRWIGPGSGLGDLSYNEKYMEGFGK